MHTSTLKPSNTHPADKLKLDIGLPASQEEDPVTWLQVTVNSTPSRQQTVETCFNKYGCLSVTLADGEDTPIFEPLPGETPLWPSLQMTGLFELPAEEKKQHKLKTKIIRNIERELGTGEIVSSILEDQEWVRTCLQDFVPIDVGHGLWIVPSWLETPVETKIALKLEWTTGNL